LGHLPSSFKLLAVRTQLFLLPLALASAALFAMACTADVKQGCVGGKDCSFDGFDPAPTSGAGGAGGGSSLPVCMPGPPTGDFPCDVFEVIHRNCHSCHGDPAALVGPFSIYSYEDIQKLYGTDPIFVSMNVAIRPGAPIRMPLGGMLNDQDTKVLGDWLSLCAPPLPDGTGCECPTGMGCTPLP
jgi:hypothetical protein